MQSNVDMTDDIFSKNLDMENSVLPKYGAHWQT
jgi:hypothetical protein